MEVERCFLMIHTSSPVEIVNFSVWPPGSMARTLGTIHWLFRLVMTVMCICSYFKGCHLGILTLKLLKVSSGRDVIPSSRGQHDMVLKAAGHMHAF